MQEHILIHTATVRTLERAAREAASERVRDLESSGDAQADSLASIEYEAAADSAREAQRRALDASNEYEARPTLRGKRVRYEVRPRESAGVESMWESYSDAYNRAMKLMDVDSAMHASHGALWPARAWDVCRIEILSTWGRDQ